LNTIAIILIGWYHKFQFCQGNN